MTKNVDISKLPNGHQHHLELVQYRGQTEQWKRETKCVQLCTEIQHYSRVAQGPLATKDRSKLEDGNINQGCEYADFNSKNLRGSRMTYVYYEEILMPALPRPQTYGRGRFFWQVGLDSPSRGD